MVLDADLINMVATWLLPFVVDDATLAVETIGEVGPGGHFFGVQHTQDRLGGTAAAVSITLPIVIVIILFQKHLVKGLDAGAVKG